jgi:uncharacterized GH25 family protein
VNTLRLVADLGPHELEGAVFDRDGQPVESASVALVWSSSEADDAAVTTSDHESRSTSLRAATTDGRGRFVFRGLGAGKHALSVEAEGFLPHRSEVDIGGGAGGASGPFEVLLVPKE